MLQSFRKAAVNLFGFILPARITSGWRPSAAPG